MRLLLVEDNDRLAQFVVKGLSDAGFTVDRVARLDDASAALSAGRFDTVVLDLGLPDGDGGDWLKGRRAAGDQVPVLMLTARASTGDKVRGLNVGADDYLAKPFSLEELLARVRSLLRRQSAAKETVLEYRHIRMDLLGRTVTASSTPVDLTSREFALLEIFLQNPGRILPRTLIAEKVWESHYDIDGNLLDVYMSKLRTKFDVTSDRPLFKTIRGVGYQMLP
jgi:DNA-binding response OmpR family regulator